MDDIYAYQQARHLLQPVQHVRMDTHCTLQRPHARKHAQIEHNSVPGVPLAPAPEHPR